MALFGKKVKDDAPASPADLGAEDGGVAVMDDPTAGSFAPPANGKKVKAARAPKAPKGKTVKNGVAVGLNIGNQFIKAVEVTSKNGELTVTAMGAVPTPAESYSNGNVLSVSALSGAIKDLWRGAGIRSKVAITSVAGTGALVVRVIEVPRMSDGELGDNMKVDADRYIPFPPSEVVMDFKALRELPTDPDAPNMEVLLAAAQREIIDLHVQVVQKAKLDPRAIDVEPIAATRAMQLERRSDGNAFIDYNEVTAIVNLGATGTEISILRGDILVFTRVVPGGGNVITQAIAEGMGLALADAERVKIERADAQAPAGYGAGAAGDFGGNDDFNFGGDEFGGNGDLNSAFDDIASNPTPPAASDDPFDLDFFNQGPKEEPGAGHAQKEGEPTDETPAFNFSGFDFDAPATDPTAKDSSAAAQTQPPSETNVPVESAPASTAFDFGFDDLSQDDLPAIAPDEMETGSVSTGSMPTNAASDEKRTAQLENFAPEVVPPASSQSISSAPVASTAPLVDMSAFSMPSAFDFDNFDLPAAAETQKEAPLPSTFDFGASATVPSDNDLTPANFGLETPDLDAQSGVEPLTFEPSLLESAPVSDAPSSFDFAASEPPTVVPAPVSQAKEPEAAPPTSTLVPADEFDLDAIFGSPTADLSSDLYSDPQFISQTVTPIADTAPTAMPFVTLEKQPSSQPADLVNVSAEQNEDEFDLAGIGAGAGDSFVTDFGDTNDFGAFGAGSGVGTADADAATLYGLIYPSLEELAGEVRRSLEFHLGRYPDATISRLVLLGGGARLRNLDVFLTQSLGVPTAVANPFAHITVQTPKLAAGYATENGPLCAVALGLALRDFVD